MAGGESIPSDRSHDGKQDGFENAKPIQGLTLQEFPDGASWNEGIDEVSISGDILMIHFDYVETCQSYNFGLYWDDGELAESEVVPSTTRLFLNRTQSGCENSGIQDPITEIWRFDLSKLKERYFQSFPSDPSVAQKIQLVGLGHDVDYWISARPFPTSDEISRVFSRETSRAKPDFFAEKENATLNAMHIDGDLLFLNVGYVNDCPRERKFYLDALPIDDDDKRLELRFFEEPRREREATCEQEIDQELIFDLREFRESRLDGHDSGKVTLHLQDQKVDYRFEPIIRPQIVGGHEATSLPCRGVELEGDILEIQDILYAKDSLFVAYYDSSWSSENVMIQVVDVKETSDQEDKPRAQQTLAFDLKPMRDAYLKRFRASLSSADSLQGTIALPLYLEGIEVEGAGAGAFTEILYTFTYDFTHFRGEVHEPEFTDSESLIYRGCADVEGQAQSHAMLDLHFLDDVGNELENLEHLKIQLFHGAQNWDISVRDSENRRSFSIDEIDNVNGQWLLKITSNNEGTLPRDIVWSIVMPLRISLQRIDRIFSGGRPMAAPFGVITMGRSIKRGFRIMASTSFSSFVSESSCISENNASLRRMN